MRPRRGHDASSLMTAMLAGHRSMMAAAMGADPPARPPDPYEVARDLWITTGDIGALAEMTEHVR